MADEADTSNQNGAGATGAGAAAPALQGADTTVRAVGEAALAQPDPDAPAPDEGDHKDPWSEPRTREDGTAVDPDDLPINHRLRSLELARRGETEDEGGLVSPELIADAAGRIAAYDAQFPPLDGKTKAQLESIADGEKVDISGAANNDERAALIAARRPALL